jgi:hypothetical protein
MRRPFALRFIVAYLAQAPLSVYSFDNYTPAITLAIVAALYIPIAIGLYCLKPKARLAALVISYAGMGLNAFSFIEPTGSVEVLATIALAVNLFTVWYLHRDSTRDLFDPDGDNLWAHWRERDK